MLWSSDLWTCCSESCMTHRGDQSVSARLMRRQSIPLNSLTDLSDCTCLHPVPLGANPDAAIQDGEKRRWYGTRVTTAILVRDDGEVTFVERDIFVQDEQGEAIRGRDERRFTFTALGH